MLQCEHTTELLMQTESSGALKHMTGDEPRNHAQQYEQAIATIIACRTIIKYDSPLGKEQKGEIIAELDTALQFLQKRLVANSAIDAYSDIPPLPPLHPEMLAELMADERDDERKAEEALEVGGMDDDGGTTEKQQAEQPGTSEIVMHNLYKLYHTYVSMEPGKGVHALAARYKLAIEAIDEVLSLTTAHFSQAAGRRIERQLIQAQGFISALYSMFQEFSAVLAGILENKNIVIETEELTSLQKYDEKEKRHIVLRDISPLLRTYGEYMQFQQRKGRITQLVSDAMAFFIFLEEMLGTKDVRKQELVERLRNVSELLHEIASLLVEYEQAFSATLAT